jgi:DNA-binding NarL/FixJ family response regulator
MRVTRGIAGADAWQTYARRKEPPLTVEDPPLDAIGRPARPSVVLADDDPFVISSLSFQLRRRFECTGAAANAGQAIDMVKALQPDVVILDVNMPGGGARHATGEIRRCAAGTAIVILSGDETREDVIELLSLGAMAYLRKGIDPAALAGTLLFAIDSHRRGPFASARVLPDGVAAAILNEAV